MKIEKVNEDKIRVTFNIDDLNEKNIDYHSFMSNSIESQKLFLDMLDDAKNKVGFVTDDYKILIETAACDNGNFICNLTRIGQDLHTTNNMTIYAFNSFDDFACFCNFFINNFKGNISIFSNNSRLILYNSTYYLLLNEVVADSDLLESFCACISEFAYFVSNSNYFEYKLMEFGEIIVNENAILTTSKFFV